MKFGKRLAAEAARCWPEACLDYKAIKRALKHDLACKGEFFSLQAVCIDSSRIQLQHLDPTAYPFSIKCCVDVCVLTHIYVLACLHVLCPLADPAATTFLKQLMAELAKVSEFYLEQAQTLEVRTPLRVPT